MKNLLFYIVCLFPLSVFAQVSVDESRCYPVEASTGLSALYVVDASSAVTMRYSSSSPNPFIGIDSMQMGFPRERRCWAHRVEIFRCWLRLTRIVVIW